MATRWVPNRAFQQEHELTPEYRKGVAFIATGVAASIRAAAQPFKDTGRYIEQVTPRGSRVHLEPHFAHIIEFGSVNSAPQGNVRRGVLAAGLRFEDSRAVLV